MNEFGEHEDEEPGVVSDADIEQAELVGRATLLLRAREQGWCTHQSAVGHADEPLYPEQEGLESEQLRCMDGCRTIFRSDIDWHDARARSTRWVKLPAPAPDADQRD